MGKITYMLTADDIAKELNCSKSYAYKLLRQLNAQGILGKEILWIRFSG